VTRSLRSPDVPRQLSGADLGQLMDDDELVGCEVTDDFVGGRARRVEISESRLVKARVTGSDLTHLRLRDVVVDGCDLSGAVVEDAHLTRCVFIDCRLSGTVLTSARLEHVEFRACRMDLVNLRMVQGRMVRFTGCDLAGSDWYSAQLHDAQLLDCDLSGADVSAASLAGTEFHGSILDGVIGAAALRDVVIDPTQASAVGLALLAAHGISITDRPAD